MIAVKQITISRGEGPNYLFGEKDGKITRPTFIGNSFDEINQELSKWALDVTPGSGGDKVDFTVVYADGQDYEGTYILKHPDEEFYPNISKHMNEVLNRFIEMHNGGSNFVSKDDVSEINEFIASYELT